MGLDQFLSKGNTAAGVLEELYKEIKNNSLTSDYKYIVYLLETYMFVNMSLIEVLSHNNAYKRAESDLERSVILTYFDIAVQQGIVYLCGFSKSNGTTKYCEIEKCMQKFKHKEDLLALFEQYKKYAQSQLFNSLKEDGKIARHYDLDFLTVVNYLSRINNENETNRIESYVSLLVNLLNVIVDFFNTEQIIIPIEDSQADSIPPRNIKCEVVLPKNKDDKESLLKLIERDEKMFDVLFQIEDFRKQLIDYEKCGMILLNQSDIIGTQIKSLTNIVSPLYHVCLVRLSIQYATKAYMESDSHFERQANAYRLMMSLYGGFDQLYGLSDKKQNNSIMKSLYKHISDCGDNKLTVLEYKVEKDLKALVPQLKKRYGNIRNIMTHNMDGRKDAALSKYYAFCELSMSQLLCDAYSFMQATNPLLQISDHILSERYPNEWKRYQKK